MPVLLTAESARRWMLDRPPRVIAPDEITLSARAVSQRVSSVAHDDATCLAPETGQGKQGKQLGLF
jgi:putative SOS response-associated peptidase YedK